MSEPNPALDQLVVLGRAKGVLTWDQIDAVIPPDNMSPEQLDEILVRLDQAGISIIDPEADNILSSANVFDELALANFVTPNYRPSPEVEEILRSNDIPFTSEISSFDSDGQVFDVQLLVPGERALEAWLKLRNLVPQFPHWPVIGPTHRGMSATLLGEPLDPSNRWHQWRKQLRADPEHPPAPFILTTEIMRRDAQQRLEEANIAPTPWTFHNRRHHSFTPTNPGPDGPLPNSEPQWDALFSNDGPFLAARGGDHVEPILPLVPIRLFPTAVPWEIFTFYPFGGWNEVPWTSEILTLFRHWYNRHGAEMVSFTDSALEVFVPRPPQTRHEAAKLIDELMWFAEESPMRFVPREADPFEYIAQQHYWSFWWD
jgi:hypothetical protein